MESGEHCDSVPSSPRAMFHEKVVLITGASSGIGAACALHFAKSSALLSLIGTNTDNLKKISRHCEEINRKKPLVITADIGSAQDVERIIADTVKHFGRIDVLVNNAGVSSMAGTQTKISAFDRVTATNLRGTYLVTNQAIPHLVKSKGNIVNVSSILSNKPLPIMTPYCLTKAAIDAFTKCTALELGPSGVRVNSVNPGPIKTELFKRGGMSHEETEQMFAIIEATSPLKKVTKSEDVAELVMFLASEKASCITGSCYIIDCGLMLGDASKC